MHAAPGGGVIDDENPEIDAMDLCIEVHPLPGFG